MSAAAAARMRHAGDPTTSLHAARHTVESGALGAQKREILALVKSAPGLTTLELASLEGSTLDRYKIAKRMKLLVEAGLVRQGEARMQGNGRLAHAYWPQETQGGLL